MAKGWTGQQIRDHACALIAASPGGIRYTALVKALADESPETPVNSIHGNVWDLEKKAPDRVAKPGRGLYVSVSAGSSGAPAPQTTPPDAALGEDAYYEPFAKFLQYELQDATDACALGGNAMKSKWGTPDVLGVYKPHKRDPIQFGTDIVAAEIKIDPGQSVVAFGQAAAYRLFSTKTYLVMPQTVSEEEKDRLDALAMLYGLGLVFFDLNPGSPDFEIRARAQRLTPDTYFVNEFVKRLHACRSELCDRLF